MKYDDLVQRAKEVLSAVDQSNWELGDLSIKAVKYHSIHKRDGIDMKNNPFVQRWADDIGWEGSLDQLMRMRLVSTRWPRKHRNPECSWSVHRELCSVENRFEIIKQNPTVSDAKRLQGRKIYRTLGLGITDGIKRLQSAESFIKSAGRIDYSKATEEELEILGECWIAIERSGEAFLSAAGMDESDLFIS